MILKHFPVEYQMDSQDCGPASLKIIAKHFGRYYSLQYLRDRCGITNQGISLLDLSTGAENIGLRTLAIKCTIEEVITSVPFPTILFWNENHFVVLYHADKQQKEREKNSFINILRYFIPYKKSFMTIFVIMFIVTLFQGILPFISKAVIDVGIKTFDLNFINMVLIGNICILLSITIFNVIRDWLLLHITSRVNIALISDYLIKLMKLPVTFFENKLLGDILQRARDHERIRNFIMNNSLSLIFSIFTFIIFGIILLIYNAIIFYIFLAGSILYVLWVLLFLS